MLLHGRVRKKRIGNWASGVNVLGRYTIYAPSDNIMFFAEMVGHRRGRDATFGFLDLLN